MSLSGGQRARVNLARALYYQADIYLLDDPLSAVDAHVAKELFKNAIKSFLETKAVILVTHQLNFLSQSPSTKILLVKDGRQVCYGSYDEIITNSEFSKFMSQTQAPETVEQPPERRRRNSTNKFGSQVSLHAKLGRQDSVVFDDGNAYDDPFLNDGEGCRIREIEDEEMPKGGAGTYTRHMGMGIFVAAILFIIAQSCYTLSDVFLKYWTAAAQALGELTKAHLNDLTDSNATHPSNNITETIRYELLRFAENTTEQTNTDDGLDALGRLMKRMSTSETVYAYSAIIVLLVIFSFSRSVTFFRSCMKASISIHDTIFARLVRAPVSFFDKGKNDSLAAFCFCIFF